MPCERIDDWVEIRVHKKVIEDHGQVSFGAESDDHGLTMGNGHLARVLDLAPTIVHEGEPARLMDVHHVVRTIGPIGGRHDASVVDDLMLVLVGQVEGQVGLGQSPLVRCVHPNTVDQIGGGYTRLETVLRLEVAFHFILVTEALLTGTGSGQEKKHEPEGGDGQEVAWFHLAKKTDEKNREI